MKSNKITPSMILLTDSYKVSHYMFHEPKIETEITVEARQTIEELSERFQQEAQRRMGFIHFTDEQIFANLTERPLIIIPDIHFFDNLEATKSPGFSGLDELLDFLDGKE